MKLLRPHSHSHGKCNKRKRWRLRGSASHLCVTHKEDLSVELWCFLVGHWHHDSNHREWTHTDDAMTPHLLEIGSVIATFNT